MSENQSKALAKFQKRAPEQHQLFLKVLAEATGMKILGKEKCQSIKKEMNQKWEHAGDNEHLREVEKVKKRANKRVTWSKNLLRVRSISPRNTQQAPPRKIVKVEGSIRNENSEIRIIPITIFNSDKILARQRHKIYLKSSENPMHHSEVPGEPNHHHNLFLNKTDFSPECKNITRLIDAEHRKTDSSIGKGDRSALYLNLSNPWSTVNESFNILQTPEPVLLSPRSVELAKPTNDF